MPPVPVPVPVPVTLLYGGLNALLNVLLGLNISLRRAGGGPGVSDALTGTLLRANRAHGNNAEWVPLGIVLLLLVELAGASSLVLHLLGGGLLAARAAHAAGMIGRNRLQLLGATLNYLVMSALAGYTLALHFLRR